MSFSTGCRKCMKCGKMYLISLFDSGLCAECEKAEQEPIEKITIWGGEQFVGIETYQQVCKERDIAIEQLHELGYELGQKIEPCNDAINRQAVLATLDDMDNVLDEDRTVKNYKELLKECYEVLPSVRPQEPKMGHWIDNHNGTISCSHCHTWFYKDDRYYYMLYCPYCGEKMNIPYEPQESEG